MDQCDWMNSGWKRGRPTCEWVEHIKQFLDFAFSNQTIVQEDTIKCPCAVCRNYFRHKRGKVELHLCQNGFKSNYKTWTAHGEKRGQQLGIEDFGDTDRMDDMLAYLAAAAPSLGDEEPIPYAQELYGMMDSAEQLVHDQTTHSTLSGIARLISIKAQHNLSIACYDDFLSLIHELLPPDSNLPKDFYHSKKLLKGLGMPYEKIHVCYNNCMFYYKENKHKEIRDFRKTPRYVGSNKVPRKVLRYMPITDRLQRLYTHELRVDAVKTYYDMYLQQRIKDSVACKKLLRQAQYAKVRPDWISEEAWRAICVYWYSPEYLTKRRLAQESRDQPDFAQNRGGSRPYGQTKQYLAKTYGPDAATDMNTFCSMKSGLKNCDSNGNSGPIPSHKAQQRVDDYFAALEAEHPDDCEKRRSDPLDPIVLYKSSGCGLAHGRVPIANGAIRKSDMKGSGRRTNTTSQANSRSYQNLVRRNAQLERNSHIGLVLSKHMKDIYEKLNMEVPAEIAGILQSLNATTDASACMPPNEQGTESSHAGNAEHGIEDVCLPAGSGGLESNGIEDNEANTNID